MPTVFPVQNRIRSFPSWERGLKLRDFLQLVIIDMSLPSWERELELIHHRVVLHHNAIGSHVVRADLKSLS